jgi:hypothetical protein
MRSLFSLHYILKASNFLKFRSARLKKGAGSPFALTLLHFFQAQRSIILINNVCTYY